jgi:transcriptional regulator with XRE-family HTH domain/predicted Fe-Mo cluster-binding NifX family protein/uncharacterized cupin superfamily protein
MNLYSANKNANEEPLSADLLVGKRLKDLRTERAYSLRLLAERSGLNINTLSLIENGKSSPSVSTLQQLSQALAVPIAAFFESEPVVKEIVFTLAEHRPTQTFGSTKMQNLAKDLVNNAVQPFVVTLQPGMGSGDQTIVHTGFEFIYCLSGSIRYLVAQEEYILNEGDSLVFEAHKPHSWENTGDIPTQILLILYPTDEREKASGHHFSLEAMKKEINMKIAAITEDGKTISQHFGRAPYYLVFTIEEGAVTKREMRDKMGHSQFHDQAHAEESHGGGHGMDAQSHNKHIDMAQAIADCKALLCGGMGMGAYESMRRLNIKPVVTDLRDIETAVQAFIDGKLIDQTELLH